MPAPDERHRPSRRRHPAALPASVGTLRILRLGDIELQIDAHLLRVGGTPVHLPNREFQVLEVLLSNAGRVVSRRELLDQIWGQGHSDVHKTVEVHINRLRRRIRAEGRSDPIRTVRGLGYVFDIPDTTRPTSSPEGVTRNESGQV